MTITVRKCTDIGFGVFADATLAGATVKLFDSLGVQVGSTCTSATTTGLCTFTITGGQDYTVTVTKTGEIPITKAIPAAVCGSNTDVVMNRGIFFEVSGCGCGIQGATISVTKTSGAGPAYSATLTTDALGKAQAFTNILNGQVYSYSISASHYTTKTGTYTASSATCSTTIFESLTSDADWWCYGGVPPICREAMPATLSVTLPSKPLVYGSLSGATVVIDRVSLGTITGGVDGIRYHGNFAITGSHIWGLNTHLAVNGQFNGNGSCTTPAGTIWVGGTDAAHPNVVGSTPLRYPMSSGTAGCPVAFSGPEDSGNASYGSVTVTE